MGFVQGLGASQAFGLILVVVVVVFCFFFPGSLRFSAWRQFWGSGLNRYIAQSSGFRH